MVNNSALQVANDTEKQTGTDANDVLSETAKKTPQTINSATMKSLVTAIMIALKETKTTIQSTEAQITIWHLVIRLSSGTVVLISFMVVTGTILFKHTCSLQSCCQNSR